MLPLLMSCAEPPSPPSPEPRALHGLAHDPDLPEAHVPDLAAAVAQICPDIQPRPLPEGDTLHRVTLSDSPARCNDGSPPVLYVRRAIDPRYEDHWIVHLDGGGSCQDHQSCIDRWCGEGPTYDAADMSSLWAPEGILANGVVSKNRDNALRGWNVAQLSYCSSDFWLGSEPARLFEGDPSYTVRFEGDQILKIAMLALGDGVISDDGTQAMPPLDLASTLVFSGSSAGGYGAGLQASDIHETFPLARIVTVVDSAFTPSREALSPEDAESLALALEQDWLMRGEGAWNAVVDTACEAVTPKDQRWRCFDVDHVVRNFLQPPVLVHHDLHDHVYGDFFMAAGIGEKEFAAASEATLRGYADLPGLTAHGTVCRQHMSLTRTPDLLYMGMLDPELGGEPVAMNQMLQDVLRGVAVSAVDSAVLPTSYCPSQ